MNGTSRQSAAGALGCWKCCAIFLLWNAVGANCVAAQTGASPSDYPLRPIRLVVPWPAGGGADIVGRAIAQELSGALGKQVVVDNRPGASAIIGTELAARAQPDGYTLLLPTVTTGINPHLHRKLPYDTQRDFEPVILIASSPYVLAVHPAVPARSVSELVALAKAKPNQINYASTGYGSAPHLTGEWFKMLSGASIVHVAYKGGTPAITDLVGGQVQMTFGNIVNHLPQVRSGKLRSLAVTGAKRTVLAPELPTMIESGLPGFVTGTWFGIQVPARTPQAIVDHLNHTLNKLLMTPELLRRLAVEGADPIGGTPRQFSDYIKAEIIRWANVVRAAGIEVDKN